jgi:type II secretory pathway pseudopilin PulG
MSRWNPPNAERRWSPPGGLSLLELAVVALVLGILLSTALPRLREAQRYSRVGLLNQMAATMHSAANLFHLQCLARQAREPGQDCAQMEVGRVWVRGDGGYPSAGQDGIGQLVGLSAGEPAAEHFSTQTLVVGGGSTLKVSIKLAEEGTCELTYEAGSPGRRPEIRIRQSTCS